MRSRRIPNPVPSPDRCWEFSFHTSLLSHEVTGEGIETREIENRGIPPLAKNAKDGAPGPYRFYFYSHEPNEPPHVHVDRDDASAKFWLDPVQLAANFGFRAHELREIQLIVAGRRTRFLEAWNEFFGIGG